MILKFRCKENYIFIYVYARQINDMTKGCGLEMHSHHVASVFNVVTLITTREPRNDERITSRFMCITLQSNTSQFV